MESFNDIISAFEHFSSAPDHLKLVDWLLANKKVLGSGHTETIRQYRSSGNKDLKKTLPMAAVGGVFENGHSMDDLVHRTGWVAIDIDKQDNPHIKDAAALRDEIAKICFVAFSGLSVSGQGVWALIKVADPDRQADHFDQLIRDFESRNIMLDTSKGRNPNDLRFLSFDPDAFIKQDFEIYDRLPLPSNPPPVKSSRAGGDTQKQVESWITELETNRIDITRRYEDWVRIGFALANEFGESGRPFFHRVSQFHPNYSYSECDKQFTRCLQQQRGRVTIATFFYLVKQAA